MCINTLSSALHTPHDGESHCSNPSFSRHLFEEHHRNTIINLIMVLDHLGFGVEIETYLQPKYAPETRRGKAPGRIEKEHYQWFVGYLTNQYALPALGNNSDDKYPHAFDRWWITFDRSLRTTETHRQNGIICLEGAKTLQLEWNVSHQYSNLPMIGKVTSNNSGMRSE